MSYLCDVKPLLVFLLIIQFATANTFMAEGGKLPFLVKHFLQHRQETPALSFVQFLKIHYQQGSSHHPDDDGHCQLPLHGNGGEIHTIASLHPPVAPSFELPYALPVSDRTCFWYAFYPTQGKLVAIFQPPKGC